jgi:regulation of enolase protein 1 (concanavalin A-like superfamily)
MVRKAGSLSLLLMAALCGAAGADLIAYYPLNEGQGTKTADATGNGNDGTLSSGVEWVAGVKGGAVRFDTAGERIVIGPIDPTAKNNAMTLAAWINWQGRNHSIAQQGIIGKRLGWSTTGDTIKWFWQTNPAGDLLFRADFSGGGTSFGWGNALLVPYANEWAHVAVTWNKGAGVQYINGKQVSTGDTTFRDSASATPVTIGCVDSTNTETFVGIIDEVRIYDTALTAAELDKAMTGDTTSASAPLPATGATDVPRDPLLSWAAGESAAGHDVYLGTDAAAVEQASRADNRGVLVSTGQSATSYKPDALLTFGQTYYWRVDEVNAPPGSAVHKGGVWSFTVEPYAYPVTNITATASSTQSGMGGPAKTIDGSGLDPANLHGTDTSTIWTSAGTKPNWIQYQFDQVYKLQQLLVWNSNQIVEILMGFGAKDVTIEYSTDGVTWMTLANVPEFARAPGMAGYAANTTVDFGGVEAKFVKLTINTTWGGIVPQTGLSEVRFMYIPVQARAPQPAVNANGVSVTATLDWRPGRDATSHKVYLDTDQAALTAGTASAATVTSHGYTPASLNFGTTYYWKVDEIGAATYPGSIWSFTTQQFAVVEDFESYTDKEGSRIYETWVDGWTNNTGSVVGYLQAPFAETTITHGGKQSMPLEYNNVKPPFYSETERTFDTAQDWTTNGADSLALWYRGYPAGFADKGNNAFTVSGGGTDIWNNGDQFRFVYKQLSGNGSLTMRVDSIANTDVWAKAGPMIRETLDDTAKNAYIAVTPASGVSFQWRSALAGTSANSQTTGLVAPYWVRLTRTGNVFKAERSADGKTWTQQGVDTTVPMAANVYIGMAVTSHNANATTTAEISNVSTTGTVTGSWQALAIGAAQRANSPAPLYLVVEDKAGKKATAVNADPAATTVAAWTEWRIPLSDLAGVNLAAVKKLTIGVGDKASPKAGAAGMLYLDDIGFGKPILPGK